MSKKETLGIVFVTLLSFTAACSKKTPIPPAPPPTQPVTKEAAPIPGAVMHDKPVVQFTAEPPSIEKGQSATLKWSVSNSTEVIIDNNIGTVDPTGSRVVNPIDSITYHLLANGPGGSTSAAATIRITSAAAAPITANKWRSAAEALAAQVNDIYFDYDKNDIKDDAGAILAKDADALRRILADFPQATVLIEGHCDERGSAEYNLALGDRRASSTRDYLTQLGLPVSRFKTVSYGKERPQCTDATEDCYQRNRRAHFAAN